MMEPDPARRRFDIFPVMLLVVIAALILAAYFLYPQFHQYMAGQDCIASGHTNC